MLLRYTKDIWCFIMMPVFMVACKKFVQVPPPVTQLVTTSVFNNDNTATAAQLAVYTEMASFPVGIDWRTGLSSDDLYTNATDQTSIDLYTNALSAGQNDPAGIAVWSQSFNYLYQENEILENL